MTTIAVVLWLIAEQVSAAPKPDLSHEKSPDPQTIRAQTDIVAATVCFRKGFDFMLRASSEYVICLHNRAGAPEAVPVKQILDHRL